MSSKEVVHASVMLTLLRGKLSFILCIYMVGIFGHLSLTVLCHCTLIKNAIADSTYLGTCDLLSNVRKVGVAQNIAQH